ncbi:MAG: HEPN domain-containing protein [Spirochaetaceae bacterium]|nr:HEPN domain-containing protein [Spirochaetaceae bacterium]
MLGEWRRAARTLSAAELLVREGYPEDAVARAYYAILHAAKAALSVRDVIAESHSSVRGLFGKHLILTGAIEREWSKQLAASLDDRLAADYDAATFFSDVEAQRECGSARAFVGRIRRYLLTCGFTDEDLTAEANNG